MSQLSFSEAEFVGKRKKTRRQEFLAGLAPVNLGPAVSVI